MLLVTSFSPHVTLRSKSQIYPTDITPSALFSFFSPFPSPLPCPLFGSDEVKEAYLKKQRTYKRGEDLAESVKIRYAPLAFLLLMNCRDPRLFYNQNKVGAEAMRC